eukprot:2712098-Pleurochrysis_carterae.AAC.1
MLPARSSRSCTSAGPAQRSCFLGPCRSPAPRALGPFPPRAPASRCKACAQQSSRLRGQRITQPTTEVKSPQTSPPRR